MIYLDYSSTSYKKPKRIIKTYTKSIKKLSINSSRGAYPLSLKANHELYKVREKIALFFGLNNPENIIFTSGCTESLNLALIGSAKKNGHIISTIYEHNSVLRTLSFMKDKYNITYDLVEPQNKNNIEVNDIKKYINKNTYLIICNHTSNVTGSTANINSIGKLCKENKIIFAVDGAQSVGHVKIDMIKSNINLLCVAGHKGLYGPQGVGILAINNVKLNPIKFGGTGTESNSIYQPKTSPECFESGTLNLPAILTLSSCLDFINGNFNKINIKIKKLSKYFLDNINKNNYEIYNNAIESGVISIKHKYKDIDELYNFLNSKKICTRNGLHCAPIIHNYLKTSKTGLIRFSIGYFNNIFQIKKVIKMLNKF